MQNTIFATVPLDEFKQFIKACVREAMGDQRSDAQKRGNKEEVLEIQEAADYLRCSTSKLYGMTSRREIPFSKPAKKVLFKKSDLDKYITDSEKPSQGQIMTKVMQSVPMKKGMK